VHNRSVSALLALAVVSMASCTTAAGEGAAAGDHAAADSPGGADTAPVGLAIADLERVTVTLREKFTALAEAMPEAALAWRPMDGVRSGAEVYVHVAADNFYVPALMGWDAPAETGVTGDAATFRAYQEREMSKAEMVAAVDASFEFFLGAMRESANDLGREVVLGSPTTVGDVWIRAVVHLHEHLGQSIAYARTSEVVPPWSR